MAAAAAAAAAALVRLITAFFVAGVIVVGVATETHYMGDWGSDFNVAAWLSARVFRVGDKLWFQNIGRDEVIVEVGGLEELENCDVSNPIRMYTDHVSLEEAAGTRYFTSANPEVCRNGLKLPLAVNSPHEFQPPSPFLLFAPPPRRSPYGPSDVPPPFKPPEPPLRIPPPPPFQPSEPPVKPAIPPPYEPEPEPIEPPVKPPPPPPVEPPIHHPPPPPSSAPLLVPSFVILVCGLHMISLFGNAGMDAWCRT